MARPRPGDPRAFSGRQMGGPPPSGAAKKSAPRSQSTVIILGCILALVAFLFGYFALTIQADISKPLAAPNAPMRSFTINQGDSFKAVTVNLENQHFIRSALVFQYYVKLKKLTPTIDPGTYQLSPSMTLSGILNVLNQGVSQPTAYITIAPGMRVTQYPDAIVGTAVDQLGPNGKSVSLPNFSAADFLKYARDGQTFTGESNYWFLQPWDTTKGAYAALEGYLYPDTYQIYQNATAVDIIKTMLDAFGRVLCPGPSTNPNAYIYDSTQCQQNQTIIDYKSAQFANANGSVSAVPGASAKIGVFDALKASGLTLQQALILASLSEREARTPLNFALVDSVYYNRLKKPTQETQGFLNADPAYQYYLGSQSNATTAYPPVDITTIPKSDPKNPYNLYANHGLPPSAISNPSAVPLLAAIDPPNTTDYWFFYAKSDCNNHYYRYYNDFVNAQNTLGLPGPNDCKS